MKQYLDEEYNDKISELDRAFIKFQKEKQKVILIHTQKINDIKARIKNNNAIIKKRQPKLNRLISKIGKIENAKITVLKSIASLGIYPLIKSNKRKESLERKRLQIENFIAEYEKINAAHSDEIKQENSVVKAIRKEISDEGNTVDQAKEEARKIWEERYSEVDALPLSVNSDKFFPLKDFSGLEYQKIIGCYIIRNKKNGKCYVGKSKDVHKRIKQHFKGTVPNNIIFAEDYYSANDRDDLFEILIIPCTTKDELDATERRLITEYEARTNGYNGTSGNT